MWNLKFILFFILVPFAVIQYSMGGKKNWQNLYKLQTSKGNIKVSSKCLDQFLSGLVLRTSRK